MGRRGPLGTVFTIVAIGLAVLTMVYGVAVVVNLLAVRTYRSTTTFPLTNTLVLHGGDSRDTLVADATDEIAVESVVRRGLVDDHPVARMDGDVLTLDGGCDSIVTSFCSVTIIVHVPRHLSLQGHIEDGSLTADGLTGAVSLSVADGRAELTRMDADSVDLSTLDGRADISLVSSPQSIRIRTGDGQASVCVPSEAPAYAITEHQGDGRIRVGIPDDPRSSRPIDLATTDGSVSLDFCR
jgi:hypothetical protein